MLSVTNKPNMLSVHMQNVIMLSAVMLNVVAPDVETDWLSLSIPC
jgi:hypothetical protein